MSSELRNIVHRLAATRRLCAAERTSPTPDAVLLQRFADHRDEAAFELLVWRHGLMVLATCRRVLGSDADVEDAFQATFLALVRSAHHIRRETLPGWLHRVAGRIAMKARLARSDRSRRERRAAVVEARPPVAADAADLGPILDAEIDRLPERFRVPFVLFHLQGMTHEEAARQLGLPKGTLLSRLAQARAKLRFRLVRRGVTLGAGAAAISLATTGELAAALVGATLKTTLSGTETATAPAVAALTEGVLRTMFLNKLKMTVGVILVAVTFATGGTLWACHGRFWRRAQYAQYVAPPVVVAEPLTIPPLVVEPPAPELPAKQPEPPSPPAPKLDRLAEVLNAYEKRRNEIESYICKCERYEHQKDGTNRVLKGEFRYLRPNYMALQMIRQDNPNLFYMFISSEGKFYEYVPVVKTIRVGTDRSVLEDFVVFPFLTINLPVFSFWPPYAGSPIGKLPERYELKITKEDENYVYISALPRAEFDRHYFKRLEFVLLAKSYLVRRMWVEYINGSEVTWDITSIDTTTKLKPNDFVPPPHPSDWKVIEVEPLKVPEPPKTFQLEMPKIRQ